MPEPDVPGWSSNLSFNSLKIKCLLTVARNPLPLNYLRMSAGKFTVVGMLKKIAFDGVENY
jgi:hypothetical protein